MRYIANLQPWVFGIVAWIGIPLGHVVWMFLDLKLRNPDSIKDGGIPEMLTLCFQWTSLAVFGIMVFASLANISSRFWRVTGTVLATAIAFGLMGIGWLFYVTGNGIDTL